MVELANVRTDVKPDFTDRLHILCWLVNRPVIACQVVGGMYGYYCPKCHEWHFTKPDGGLMYDPCGLFPDGVYLTAERIYLYNSGYFPTARRLN